MAVFLKTRVPRNARWIKMEERKKEREKRKEEEEEEEEEKEKAKEHVEK